MTRRVVQQLRNTLIRVPDLKKSKQQDFFSDALPQVALLKERLSAHHRHILIHGRIGSKTGAITKKSYSFAGHQRSTKISTFFKNDVDTRFSAMYKKNIGRNLSGTITVYTKGSAKKHRFTNYTQQLNKLVGFVAAVKIYRDANSFKLVVMYATSSGALIALPLTSRTKYQNLLMAVGTYTFIRRLIGYAHIQRLSLCQQVRLARAYRAVSYVATAINSRVTIAKASGSCVKVLRKRKKTVESTTLIQQPSGKLRFISSYVIVLTGYIKPRTKKTFKNSRAGY